MNKLRLDELLVKQELSTYRRARRFLQEHTVLVNNVKMLEAGTIVDLKHDILSIDGEIHPLQSEIYLMMNKKQNTVCTADEGWHERVFESIEEKYLHPKGLTKLHAVGRLDLDTEGFLLLTTDGKLSHKLTDPTTHITKTYLVYLRDFCTYEEQQEYSEAFAKGVTVPAEKKSPEFIAQPAELRWYDSENHDEIEKYCTLAGAELPYCTLKITEGKFHQVRRMFLALGNQVIKLHRIKIGTLSLPETLETGMYEILEKEQLDKLRKE